MSDVLIQNADTLITMDDGWKSTYTDAYPILKEFGYPFTVFLYTNYIDGGTSALTSKMIKEMQFLQFQLYFYDFSGKRQNQTACFSSRMKKS